MCHPEARAGFLYRTDVGTNRHLGLAIWPPYRSAAIGVNSGWTGPALLHVGDDPPMVQLCLHIGEGQRSRVFAIDIGKTVLLCARRSDQDRTRTGNHVRIGGQRNHRASDELR